MSSRLGSSEYSSLALDLMISRVGQAALKTCAGIAPDSEEISIAKKLNDFFHSEIEAMESSRDLENDVVPDDSIREVLIGTLATLSPPNGTDAGRDHDLLQVITGILDKLIDQRNLADSEANALVDALLGLPQAAHEHPHIPAIRVDDRE